MTSCSHQIDVNLKGGEGASNAVACTSFTPFYLDNMDAITRAALDRTMREWIATHNRVWEQLCNK